MTQNADISAASLLVRLVRGPKGRKTRPAEGRAVNERFQALFGPGTVSVMSRRDRAKKNQFIKTDSKLKSALKKGGTTQASMPEKHHYYLI